MSKLTTNLSLLKNTAVSLLIIIAGFLLYSNTFEVPFLFDGISIQNNQYIRINAITIDSLLKAIFKTETTSLRPCTSITFALNYYFHQYSLKGYHIVNILIHLLSGILLYFFLKKTLSIASIQPRNNNPDFIALSAALLWIVHPLHTQSVTYIVQRMNSMSAMFYVLSLLLYVTGRTRQQQFIAKAAPQQKPKAWLFFAGTFVAWLMAIGSKENAAVLPFFIFLYEWYFFQDLDRTWLQRNIKIVFAAVILFGLTAFIFMGSSPLERIQAINDFKNQHFTFWERVLTQPRVIIYYVTLLFYPHPSRLSIDYDFPLSHSLIDPATTLLSCFVIISLIGTAVYFAKQERMVSFCIIWFLGNLAIESSVIPLAVIFEHRTYLPSMMICLLPVIIGQRYIPAKRIGIVLLCVTISIFSFWTYQRNSIWNDPAQLWGSCVKKYPNKARPHNNLGNALKNQGEGNY